MTTSTDIVNRALQEIAGRATVTGLWPNFTAVGGGPAAAASAANILYGGAVQFMLRSRDWEFARRFGVALTLDGNQPPPLWAYEYAYPADCLRLRQVLPATSQGFDPQPVTWDVVAVSVNGAEQRAILAQIPNALATYTTSNVTENDWDAVFTEAMVRYLGSELAMAIGGRPDFSKEFLSESQDVAQGGFGLDS